MQINTTDASAPSGFYAVNFDVFCATLAESKVSYSVDLGGVTLHYGTRDSAPIWLMDNPAGLYGVWVEEDADSNSPH
jgi:hypothetical protein